MKGIDYSCSPPSAAALKAAGVQFAARYLSWTPSKNLTYAERNALLNAGIAIAVVWETTAGRMLSGSAAGVADAHAACGQADALNLPGVPIYFACDYDATESDQVAINAYLDGVASVLGHGRTGIYGGYWPVKRAFDAGKVTYGWQTYAWSGNPTLWDDRAQLRQVQTDVMVAGISADWDMSMTADFGQWPRPGDPMEPVLSEGGTGPAVVRLQQRLNIWGATLNTDGDFGPATLAAVRAFQQAHGLSVDGVVGPATWAALDKTPLVPGQLPAPSWLAVDKTRLALTWGPVSDPACTGYTAVAYGMNGHEYGRATSAVSWCTIDHLTPGWAYTVNVWANGGKVAPNHASITVTMPS